jgi:hypothetical protein
MNLRAVAFKPAVWALVRALAGPLTPALSPTRGEGVFDQPPTAWFATSRAYVPFFASSVA